MLSFMTLKCVTGMLDFMALKCVTGMLSFMSSRNTLTFLQCLTDSYRVAFQFDSRPGLKFLVQKVSRMEVAANMYKQAGVSMTVYLHTLIEICSRQDNICVHGVKSMLATRCSVNTRTTTANTHNGGVDVQRVEEVDKTFQEMVAALKLSRDPLQKHMTTFVCLLKDAFDESFARFVTFINCPN